MCADRQGKVWVIEADVQPALSLFRQLKDKQMYLLMREYAKKAQAGHCSPVPASVS
jgi:hypothetical protein